MCRPRLATYKHKTDMHLHIHLYQNGNGMLKIANKFDYSAALEELKILSETDFLGGPGRDADDIEIDPLYAGSLADALEALASDGDIVLKEGKGLNQDAWPQIGDQDEFVFKTPTDPTYGVAYGVVAIKRDNGLIVGAYTGCSLAVDRAHQGRGIGTSLIMLRFLCDQSLPLWEHDKPGYSPQGALVHRLAYEELQSLQVE